MKKLFTVMSVVFISSSAVALTSTEVLMQKGQYAFDVLANNSFKEVIGEALLTELVANTSASTPSEIVDGRFLVIAGCQPHNCEPNNATIFIDSKNPSAVLIVRVQDSDFLAKDQKQKNVVFIRNKEWVAKVDEGKFPQLNAKVLSLQ